MLKGAVGDNRFGIVLTRELSHTEVGGICQKCFHHLKAGVGGGGEKLYPVLSGRGAVLH